MPIELQLKSKELKDENKIDEIARMISGASVTSSRESKRND